MKWLGNCRESRFSQPLYIGGDSSACDVVRCLPPVQDGVCPYKVEPCSGVLNITIKSTIVVRSRSRSCGGGDICGTTPAYRSHVNIATVAMRNSF